MLGSFHTKVPLCGFTQVVVAQATADYLGLTALIRVKSIKQRQAQGFHLGRLELGRVQGGSPPAHDQIS